VTDSKKLTPKKRKLLLPKILSLLQIMELDNPRLEK